MQQLAHVHGDHDLRLGSVGKQIARILGFSSLSYFSQSFHRTEGVSPMEYRKLHTAETRQQAGENGG